MKNESICSAKLAPQVARFASGFVEQALAACDPVRLIEQHMELDSFESPTHVVAFGKASSAMATACRDRLRDRFAGGVVLCPDEQIPSQGESIGLEFHGVDHPNPTSRNVQATQRVIEYARSIPADHSCLVCISGGGSAHLCSPASGVTLDEIIERTRALNAAGSTIQQLNRVRKQLETLKGGGLAELLSHIDHVEACVLSDVMGDDLDTIASGPMRHAEHSIKHTIIGNHRTLRDACTSFVHGIDQATRVRPMDARGDAVVAGQALARSSIQSLDAVYLATGETTVDASGTGGIGGPCMESVLAAGMVLAESGQSNWITIGLASDGIDGPTGVAGAVLTGEMMSAPGALKHAHKAMSVHDSLEFFRSSGGEITTGPSGTNVNDVVMICPKRLVEAFLFASKWPESV